VNLLVLFGGIVLAGALFAAFIWSGYQAVFARGRLRLAHLALVVLVLAGMLSLTWLWPLSARAAGGGLVLAGLAALGPEHGWARLLVVAQMLLGVVLISGLPLAGG